MTLLSCAIFVSTLSAMAHYLKRRRQSTLTLSTPKDLCMLLWIAEKKGFLAAEKLKIKFVMVPYARKSMELLVEGEVDLAILVETNVAYLGYLKPKTPIKCIASVETRLADNLLLRNDQNISQTPRDLIGKQIGFTPRTSSHSFLINFLKHHKIDKSDISLKALSPQIMGDALIRGDIDAASFWQPYVHNAIYAMKDLGLAYTHFPNTGFYASEVVLAASKPFLIKNKHSIKSVLIALKKAEEYMSENQNDIAPLLAKKLKVAGQNHENIWKQFKPNLKPIGPEYLKNIETLSEWIGNKDTAFKDQQPPNYLDFIDNSTFLDIFPNSDYKSIN